MTLEERVKEREDFEDWLFEMDDKLEEFFDSFSEDVSEKLDYSLSSLDVLESWLLNNFSTPKQFSDNKDLWDKVGRYVGETYRKNLGGIWDVELDDLDNIWYKLPILRIPNLAPECPLVFGTAAIDRKRGNYLRVVLENMIGVEEKQPSVVLV